MATTTDERTEVAALIPRPGAGDRPSRTFGEQSAVVWLWAWPRLLGWHAPVAWLFCSVTGNTTGQSCARAGDLWGVDAAGDLLIVEAKTAARGRRAPDPFADFVGPAKALLEGGCPDTHPDNLQQHWVAQLDKEHDFITKHAWELESGVPLRGTYPGVVNYSRKRAAVRVWRDLYTTAIVSVVKGLEYRATVERYLARRRQRSNPGAHAIGLVAVLDGARSSLSIDGENHRDVLRKAAPGHVHLVNISATIHKHPATTTFRSWPPKP